MTDTCPNCTRRGTAPITEHQDGDQVSHLYRCAGCGHVWSTNRDLRFYGKEAA
ncbi:hypothetical protein [Streptomyces sp. NPDC057580]|uniref:hypothetical protein n=1 Tax=Streptomyces sp. NPDC057580 TaxID=3346173 RepID=UPI0036A962F3